MLVTTQAYQDYIALVPSFVGQLEALPMHFAEHENKAVRLVFPGPAGWMTGAVMKSLKAIVSQLSSPILRCAARRLRQGS